MSNPLLDLKIEERGAYAISLLNDVACSNVATAEIGIGGVVDANAG